MTDDRYKLNKVPVEDTLVARFQRFMHPAGLVVGGPVAPHWMRDGVSFWYATGTPHNTVFLRADGESGVVTPLLDVAKTRRALATLLGRNLPDEGLPFDSVKELEDGRFQFCLENTQYTLSPGSYAVEKTRTERQSLPQPALYPRPMWQVEPLLVAEEARSPDGHWLTSLRDGNIVLRASADGRTVALTTDGTADFAWDLEAPCSRFYRGKPIELDPWSPDGLRLFALKVDRRAVPDLPFIRYLKREEEVCSFKIQRAGGPMDISHPHVIDVLSKHAVRFDLGDTENQFFTLIGWLADGSEVLFSRHSRDFKTVEVLAGNPSTGSVRTVLSESAATFVAIQHEVILYGNNHITLLPGREGLIWRSARSGWNHFYLYGLNGTLIRALTEGEFPVIAVMEVDSESGWVYFTAHHDRRRPYDTHLCRVKLTGGAIERLTPLDGENVVSISPSKKTFTAVNSRPDRPFRTDFHRCDGTHLATIERADVSSLEALGYVEPEEFAVLAADGKTELWGVMYKPAGFDPKQKYPVIDHIYGGPQVAVVSHDFSLGDWTLPRLDRALAQLGYIVISVDARGTPERSKAFQDVVYRNFGRHEIPDHVAAIRQLAERHTFIDLERVGIFGHSWGGYFTLRAMAQAADVFRVGVASAPVTDPHDLILYEPYLDLPSRAPEAYDYANLYPLAGQVTGKLLLAVGSADPVMYSSTLEMCHYLIQAGVDHELVVLPEAGHGYEGKNDDYFVHKLVKHFVTHLPPHNTV